MNQELKQYIEKNIFPMYRRYYSHGMLHVNNVINNCLMLANYYNLDINKAYTIAAYHDVGLYSNRDNHEKESGEIFVKDQQMKKYFSDAEIEEMKEAIEDHRGSRKETPRNMYGKILSDSDRDFDIEILAKRQLATSIKNYPDLTTFEEHFERCYSYMTKRIEGFGHFNLWTNNPILVKKRDKFEKDYLNKEYTKNIYKEEWKKISADGTIDKIKNYYLDY
ncbi:MAG: HD domain-containing protein [Clostridia bacterium]